MERFQREAHVLASLNHSNIATIYGVEDSDSAPALVMELVDGPTLADRIAQGPIPIDEVLNIATQIAEALEYAHERGVVHRDLKPANIKLTPDGKVKVLDFGLAKAMSTEGQSTVLSNSPTLSLAATQAGVILGSASYMSPEQAKGKPVDRRADIWAFGVVVYEMLTARMIFDGDTGGLFAGIYVDTLCCCGQPLVFGFASQRPDMSLAPAVDMRFGLGLWNSRLATFIVEGALWLSAVVLYARSTKPIRQSAFTILMVCDWAAGMTAQST